MKLRMRQNSVRLRLTRSELARFAAAGVVEEAVEFPSGTLLYRIERSRAAQQMTAELVGASITVVVPDHVAEEWVSSRQTGFEARCGSLDILIEKDFQCEHGAEDDDAFTRQEVS